MNTAELLMRIAHSGISIYMILVLLRWLGPWIGLEMAYGRWKWIPRVTDPVINRIRQIIPNLGPVDFGPIATIFILWFVRVLLVSVFFDVAARSTVT